MEVGDFIHDAGFSLEKEALGVTWDGNIRNVPHSVTDVKRHYDIYRISPVYLRGKMTADKKDCTSNTMDEGVRKVRSQEK